MTLLDGPHRKLVIAWLVTLAAIAIAFVTVPAIVGVLWYATLVLAILTYRRTTLAPHEVTRRFAYRGTFGLLLAVSATAAIAGGSSFVVDPATGKRLLSLGTIAGTNLVIAICAWRALVNPLPKRAALAAGLATVLELLALIGDAVVMMKRTTTKLPGLWDTSIPARLAVVAAITATCIGLIGCVVALVAFRPTTLPEARLDGPG